MIKGDQHASHSQKPVTTSMKTTVQCCLFLNDQDIVYSLCKRSQTFSSIADFQT